MKKVINVLVSSGLVLNSSPITTLAQIVSQENKDNEELNSNEEIIESDNLVTDVGTIENNESITNEESLVSEASIVEKNSATSTISITAKDEWQYGEKVAVSVLVQFPSSINTDKMVEINLPKGMVFDSYPVMSGTLENGIEFYGPASEMAAIDSIVEKPTQDSVTNLYGGTLKYKVLSGATTMKLTFYASVDRYRYIKPTDIRNAIIVTSYSGTTQLASESIDIKSADLNSNPKVNTLSTATGNRTAKLTPGAEGTTYSYYRNTTSKDTVSISGYPNFTYIDKLILNLYYPEGTEYVRLNNLNDKIEIKDENITVDKVNHQVTVTLEKATIDNVNVSLTYKVPDNQFGAYSAKDYSTMTVRYFDGTEATVVADKLETVEVVDPSSLTNVLTVKGDTTADIKADDGVNFDYGGASLSTGGFIYIPTSKPLLKDYIDQVFEYSFENWKTRKVLIPFELETAVDIKYRLNGESEIKEYTVDLTEYQGKKRVIDADALGLPEDRYFEWVSFTIAELKKDFSSITGRYNEAVISFGNLIDSTKEGKTEISIYSKGDTTKKSQHSVRIQRGPNPQTVGIGSGNVSIKDAATSTVTKSAIAGTTLIATTLFEANKAFNSVWNQAVYLENPEIYIRMPKGFSLSTGTIRVKQGNKNVVFTLSSHDGNDGSVIYTLKTTDTKVGGYNPQTLERYEPLVVNFQFTTLPSVNDNYDLKDMIFIGQVGSHMGNADSGSGLAVTDTFGLLQTDTTINNEARKIASSQTFTFNITKSTDLEAMPQVVSKLNPTGSQIYDPTDSSTATLVELGEEIELKFEIANNSDAEAETFTAYIPIPKEGDNFGDKIQSEAFKWNMNLVGTPTVSGTNISNSDVTFEYATVTNGDFENANYSTTLTDTSNMIKLTFNKNIPINEAALVTLKYKINVSDADINSDHTIVDKMNEFNIYYLRKYSGGASLWTKSKSVGIKLHVLGEAGGTAFLDTDHDGVYDVQKDKVLNNVSLTLVKVVYDPDTDEIVSEQEVAKTTTNAQGEYKFEKLQPGNYEIRVENPQGADISLTDARTFTIANQGGDYKVDSNFTSHDNVNGIAKFTFPSQDGISDSNSYIGLGFTEPITVDFETDGNGTISTRSAGPFKIWPNRVLPELVTVIPNQGYGFRDYTIKANGATFDYQSDVLTENTTLIANFYRLTNEKPIINGTSDLEIPVSKVNGFDLKDGITFIDDYDTDADLLANLKIEGSLGTPAPGTNEVYTIKYTVTDSDNNVVEVERNITVTNQKPIIEGLSDIIVRKGNTGDLTAGVTATDYEDGKLTDNIVIPKVDWDNLSEGTHKVTYSVKDKDNNTTEVERTIVVESNNAPIITGADAKTLKASEVATFDNLDGVSYTDDHDSNLKIEVTGKVEKPAAGTNQDYILIYKVTDSDNNTTEVERKITVTNQKPMIEGLSTITVRQGNTGDLTTGVIATDHEDGIITDKIVIPTVNWSKLNVGTHQVKYTVTDIDNNMTEVERTIVVESNNAPIITGADAKTLKASEVATFDNLDGVSYTDDHDSNLKIEVTGKVEKPAAGTNQDYILIYKVTDSDNNTTEVERKITVTNQMPVIQGLDAINIRQGNTGDLTTGVTATDHEDGTITDKIVIPTVDWSKLSVGSHQVKYTVTDSDNNTTEVERTIIVESNNAPIITGADHKTIKVSEVETFDPLAGVSYTDDHDSTGLKIAVTGKVEKPAAGTNQDYVLTYEVTDKDGNKGTAQRIITVTNQLPVIQGLDAINIRQGNTGDLTTGVTATDHEDGTITDKIVIPTVDWSQLPEGTHQVKYKVTDSDNNTTEVERTIIVESNNAPVITGADHKTIKVSEVETFDPLAGVSYTDDHDSTGLKIAITGKVEKPAAGTNEDYVLTYEVTDNDNNTTRVERIITVTNQVPTISGLDEIVIREGQGANFDFKDGITSFDYEDGNLTGNISYPTTDLSQLPVGTHTITYVVIDNDGNKVEKERVVRVESNNPPVILGAINTTIKVSEVEQFNQDLLDGITYSDDHDPVGLNIKVTGIVGKPAAGTNEDYKLIYEVTDTDNNTTRVERIITVTNQVPTISGLDEIIIKKGQGENFDFVAGVTANDHEDGDITGNIIYPTTDLSQLPVGIHTVTYMVKDKDGNKVEQERIVQVLKNEAPVIHGVDHTIIKFSQVEQFNQDLLAGVSYTDDYDSIGLTINVTGTVGKPAAGTNEDYILTYEVTDNDNNTTRVERIITVTNQVPTISGLGEIIIKKGQGENFDFEAGVTANDHEDGDITGNITYPNIDLSTLDVGRHEIEYIVADYDGNIKTEKRIVSVISNNPPLIIGATNTTIKLSEVDHFNQNLLAGISYSDDHDLTGLTINVTGTVGKPAAGTNEDYVLTYEVTDNDNNTTRVERIVTVTNQVPTILGLNEIVIRKGQQADLQIGVTAYDYEDGNITGNITYPNIDLSTLDIGRHELEYSVTDVDGNRTTKKRIVSVVSNNAPVIIGVTNTTIKISEVDKFNEDLLAGISYSDDHDSTGLTINVTGIVGKPAAGTNEDYILTYEVTDTDGNTTTINRVITVTNQLPMITGLNEIVINKGQLIDLQDGVHATDYEDGDITGDIIYPAIDSSNLAIGRNQIIYTVTDSDGNTVTFKRIVTVLKTEDSTNNSNNENHTGGNIDNNITDNSSSNISDNKLQNQTNISSKPVTGYSNSLAYIGSMFIALGNIVLLRKRKND